MKQILKVLLCLCCMVACSHECLSQKIIIGARDEFQVTVGYGSPIGPKKIGNDLCLFTHMKSGLLYEARYTSRIYRNLSLGAWGGLAQFKNQDAPKNFLYDGTAMKFVSFGPLLTFKTSSFRNMRTKVQFVVAIAPGVSQITVTTTKDSEVNGTPAVMPLTVKSQRFTLGTSLGLNYIFNQSVGMSIGAGYQYTEANSKIFPDKTFSSVNVRLGVFFRLFKDKKYKYSVV